MQDALPVHTVELDAFYMDVNEVTVGQFREFVNQSGYSYDFNQAHPWGGTVAKYSPGDEYPMVYVSWNDATAYTKWAGKRLPTEAEWEYAARGGLAGKRYPWGDEISHGDANWGNTVNGKDKWNYCSPVGSFEANGYGLYDMAGNVYEWCQDWYGSDYYSNSAAKNPPGPGTGSYRVLRGGSWLNLTTTLRVARRINHILTPDLRSHLNGFRCVSGLNFTSGASAVVPLPLADREVLDLADTSVAKVQVSVNPIKVSASVKAIAEVTVALYNPDKNLIKGGTANLTVDIGTIHTPAKDNGDGTYTAIYTAGRVAGKAKISAVTAAGKFGTTTIILLDTKVKLTAQKTTLPASPSASTVLTIHIKDSEGNPVKGETLKLKADKGTIQPPVDNGDGTYTAKYTAANVVGDDTVAVITGAGKQAKISLKLLSLVPSASKSSLELAGSATVQTGEIASALVTLKTADGSLVTGHEVTLVVDPADNLKLIPTVVTDREGRASFKFTSSQSGIRMITASAGEVKLDASVAVIFSGDAVDTIPITAGIDPNRIEWEKDEAEMVLVPTGSFEMGDHLDGMEDALPVHSVELYAFYMDVHEVTVGQFRKFVQQSGYLYGGNWNSVAGYSPGDDYPMVYVTWNDAVAYAEWAGKRLPTEAEWEYAARGGLVGKRYPWGDEITHDDANWGNTINGKDKWRFCSPVGSFQANGYGLYDMAGNVSEWCADRYGENYYSSSPAKNPPGSGGGRWRVFRGGSYYSFTTTHLSVAYRSNVVPNNRLNDRGFRCVSGSHTPDSFTDLPDRPNKPVTDKPVEEVVTPPTVNTITFKSDATTLIADGTSTAKLTISLKDTTEQALSGQTVTLSTDIGTVSTAKDNGDGTYTTTYTAGSKAGTATVTAKTANGKTATVQITLTAKETVIPSFVLSVLKPELSIKAGRFVTYLITLQGQGGFTDTISFFQSGAPKNVEAVFNPQQVKLTADEPIQTAQLTLTAPQEIEVKDHAPR